MPLYQQLIIARDVAKPADLVALLKQCTATVMARGGTVRAIENHGIRALGHRLRNRRAMEEEQKYHWRARYVSALYDSNPDTVREVERHLRLDDNVLRFFTLRPRTQADLIRSRKGFKSEVWKEPYDPQAQADQEDKRRSIFD